MISDKRLYAIGNFGNATPSEYREMAAEILKFRETLRTLCDPNKVHWTVVTMSQAAKDALGSQATSGAVKHE